MNKEQRTPSLAILLNYIQQYHKRQQDYQNLLYQAQRCVHKPVKHLRKRVL